MRIEGGNLHHQSHALGRKEKRFLLHLDPGELQFTKNFQGELKPKVRVSDGSWVRFHDWSHRELLAMQSYKRGKIAVWAFINGNNTHSWFAIEPLKHQYKRFQGALLLYMQKCILWPEPTETPEHRPEEVQLETVFKEAMAADPAVRVQKAPEPRVDDRNFCVGGWSEPEWDYLDQVYQSYKLPGQKKSAFWRGVLMTAVDQFDRDRGGTARDVLRLKCNHALDRSNAAQ